MKRNSRLGYKSHRFQRENDWHKCRASVLFAITTLDGRHLGEKTIEIDISDRWLPHTGPSMPRELPLDLFCKALSVAAEKMYVCGRIDSLGQLSVNEGDAAATVFSSPSECVIDMISEPAV